MAMQRKMKENSGAAKMRYSVGRIFPQRRDHRASPIAAANLPPSPRRSANGAGVGDATESSQASLRAAVDRIPGSNRHSGCRKGTQAAPLRSYRPYQGAARPRVALLYSGPDRLRRTSGDGVHRGAGAGQGKPSADPRLDSRAGGWAHRLAHNDAG